MLSDPQHPQNYSTMLSHFQNTLPDTQQSSALTELPHNAQPLSELLPVPQQSSALTELHFPLVFVALRALRGSRNPS